MKNGQTSDALLKRITIDPEVCGGKPCIRGMRIRVSDILDLMAAGAAQEEILTDYPYLEEGDLRASLAYAARNAKHVVIESA
jgi:uncharacterized protein (DUF433 family)